MTQRSRDGLPRRILDKLARAYQDSETLSGVIGPRADGGIMIYVADIVGFLPKAELPSSYSHRAYKGHEICVKITNLEREGRGRVYLSLESLPSLPDLSAPKDSMLCKSCDGILPQLGKLGDQCSRCYRLSHPPARIKFVQAGSPGLKTKLTIRVAERRTRHR